MKKKQIFYLFTGLSMMLFSCYPDGPEYIDEFDLVITNYDNTFTFSGHNKYAMPDSIVKITGEFQQGNPMTFLEEPYASGILDRIKSNMSSLGYTLVEDTTLADLILFPSDAEVTYINYYYDYYYYYGWYYPYYYGWYYPYQMVTTYTTGTLFMNLINRHEVTASGKLRVVWTGLINGVLDYYTGTSADKINRISKSIDQAFTQSSYLHQ